jgi:hypothetical protein
VQIFRDLPKGGPDSLTFSQKELCAILEGNAVRIVATLPLGILVLTQWPGCLYYAFTPSVVCLVICRKGSTNNSRNQRGGFLFEF